MPLHHEQYLKQQNDEFISGRLWVNSIFDECLDVKAFAITENVFIFNPNQTCFFSLKNISKIPTQCKSLLLQTSRAVKFSSIHFNQPQIELDVHTLRRCEMRVDKKNNLPMPRLFPNLFHCRLAKRIKMQCFKCAHHQMIRIWQASRQDESAFNWGPPPIRPCCAVNENWGHYV